MHEKVKKTVRAYTVPIPCLYRAYGVPMRAYGLICPIGTHRHAIGTV
jgi:hypothetical protein